MVFQSIRFSFWQGAIVRRQISCLCRVAPQSDRSFSTFQAARKGAPVSHGGQYNSPQTQSRLFIQDHVIKTTTKGDVLRLMPLGGSITHGVGSSDGTGYRKSLLEMLQRHGINACMVGSRKDGSMPNSDHEGWRGFRIDQIESKARKSVARLCPDIFMINAGSNDCLQSFEIDRAGKRMGDMLDYLWFACPESTVLLSTLLVNADKDMNLAVISFNEQYRALARRKSIEGKKIILVDMYPSDEPGIRGLYDGIHPDDENYKKMGRLWFTGVQEAIQKGFIDGPQYEDNGVGEPN